MRLKRVAAAAVVSVFAGLISMPDLALSAAATGLVMTASTPAPTAGASFSITVTAQDPNGMTDPTYAGTIHFTSTDTASGAVLPPDSQLSNGQGTFSATLVTAGQQSVTVTDAANSLSGNVTLNVTAAPADHLSLEVRQGVVAGFPFGFLVIAHDRYGNIDRSYADRGTVHFTSSDTSPGVVLPADSAVTSGFWMFSATLDRAGPQTVTATDTQISSITGTLNVLVRPGPAAAMSIAAPETATVAAPFDVTVTLLDRFGNVATGASGPPPYTGTVHFTSTDPLAMLPPDYTFTASDAGVHRFSDVVLLTPGDQTITVSDVTRRDFTATTPTITVTLAPLRQ